MRLKREGAFFQFSGNNFAGKTIGVTRGKRGGKILNKTISIYLYKYGNIISIPMLPQ